MRYHHGGAIGDILFSIPTILSMQERHDNGNPARLYLGSAKDAPVIPLLAAQPYFAEVKLHEGEPFEVNLDLFRLTGFPVDKGHLARQYFYAFHANFDLSKPWLFVEPDEQFRGRVVVGRTARYRNHAISYAFMNEFNPVFLGHGDEYEAFKKEVPCAEFIPTQDLLEAARIIAASRVFVQNQSSLWVVAEAMKVPRVLETYLIAPNALPVGATGWDAINQLGFEAIVKELASTAA